jgi:hypothetical protein
MLLSLENLSESALILIPYDCVADPEKSTCFYSDTPLLASEIDTVEALQEEVAKHFVAIGYWEENTDERSVQDWSQQCAVAFKGAAVICAATLSDANKLSGALTQYGANDDSFRDNRIELIFKYCLMHAIRFIGDPPAELVQATMRAVPPFHLEGAIDALDDAVERYDLIGGYDRDSDEGSRG